MFNFTTILPSVYEEIVTANPAVHDNPAYENPMRMRLEENPAYVSTHFYSRCV